MAVLTSSLRANGAPAILAAAIGFATLQAVRPCAAADDASPVHAYYYFVHWVSMGRADLAAEQFADDAVVIGNPVNLQLQSFSIEAWVKRASATQVSNSGGAGVSSKPSRTLPGPISSTVTIIRPTKAPAPPTTTAS